MLPPTLELNEIKCVQWYTETTVTGELSPSISFASLCFRTLSGFGVRTVCSSWFPTCVIRCPFLGFVSQSRFSLLTMKWGLTNSGFTEPDFWNGCVSLAFSVLPAFTHILVLVLLSKYRVLVFVFHGATLLLNLYQSESHLNPYTGAKKCWHVWMINQCFICM